MNFADRVNTEAQYNLATAFEIGIRTPDLISIKDISDEDRRKLFLDGSWLWIHDTYTAMKRMDSCRATFYAHWNGEKIGHYYISVDDRSMFGLGMGPELVSNCMTVFPGYCQIASELLEKLIKYTVEKDPSYIGFVSLDLCLDGGEAFYQGITIGATPSFAWCLERLHAKPLEDIFMAWEPVDGYACCARLYRYPYSLQENQTIANLVPSADFKWDGESFIVFSKGSQIKKAWHSLYDRLEGMEKYGIIYRRDGDILPRRVMFQLKTGKYL